MSIAVAFWVCFLIACVLGLYGSWPRGGAAPNLPALGGNLLLFLLLFLLGWAQFGPPIK